MTQTEKLTHEGQYFRRKRQGCVTSRRSLLAAKKPKNFPINIVALHDIDLSLYTEDEENTDSEN